MEMTYKNGKLVHNETIWTDEMILFLKDNYLQKNNAQLASYLGLRLTTTRTKLYELGLKRMELEYWTDEQIQYLKEHYQSIGDVEIAEIFNQMYYKAKGWTKKHIEKKRRYLNLKRTKKQQVEIHKRNTKAGRFSINHWKIWVDRVAPVGEVRVWVNHKSNRPFKVIKTNEGFVHYAPWLYIEKYGPIPDAMVVRFKDDDPLNVVIENLELIPRSENALRNSKTASIGLSDNYVLGLLTHNDTEMREKLKQYPEIIQVKKQQLILNRQIKSYEQK